MSIQYVVNSTTSTRQSDAIVEHQKPNSSPIIGKKQAFYHALFKILVKRFPPHSNPRFLTQHFAIIALDNGRIF